MPTGASYGRNNNPSNNSQGHFSRLGPSESALAQFLYPFAWRSVVFWFDDFTQGKTTLTDCYTLGTDACQTAFATAAGIGGVITGATGAADNAGIAILTEADWEGDKNAGQEMRWQTNNVLNTWFEQGFTDPLTDDTLGATNDPDTPSITNGATDVAIVAKYSQQNTANNMYFLTDGVTSNMNTTKTDLCCITGTNSAYHASRVQIITNAAQGSVFNACGVLQGSAQHGAATACSIEGGTDLTARLFFSNDGCVAHSVTVDYWAIWMDR